MTKTGWWRSKHGAPKDTKWRLIARMAGVPHGNVAAIAWCLLDHASQAEERGSIAGYDLEEIAEDTGYPIEEVERVLAAMQEKGFLDGDRIAGWAKQTDRRRGK